MMNLFSIEAYRKIEPELTERQAEVFRALSQLGRATLDQIAQRMGVPKFTISGRITELKKMGLIREAMKDGKKLRGKSEAGNPCAILELC